MTTLIQRESFPRLYIDGLLISNSLITKTITVTRQENDSAILEVNIRPTSGVQDLNKYQGKSIILTIQTATGIHRVFTGVIDVDEYDLQQEYIRIRATDDRFNLIRQNSALVNSIGFHSVDVFGEQTDNTRLLENRLSTIPSSLDSDGYNNFVLTSWTPKATADYTLTSSQVYRVSPKVERTHRAKLTNTININLTYAFQRLHHRERDYSWNNNVVVCDYLLDSYSIPTREMVRQAAAAAGWPVKNGITFTPFYNSNSYRCGGILVGLLGTSSSGVSWTNRKSTVIDGEITQTNVYDSSGNPQQRTAIDKQVAGADALCIGATWTATTRFSQNMVESYTLTVQATQSTSDYGIVAKTEQLNMNDDYDTSEWENYKAYTSPPDDAVFIENSIGDLQTDYYIDKDLRRGDFNTAVTVLLNRAKTEILRSHRQNKVVFSRSIWPELQLYHTVELSTNKVAVKGKTSSIKHVIDISTGEAYTDVELSFYNASGSAVASAFTPPTRPVYIPVVTGGSQFLGNHYGEDPQAPGARGETWNGMIGNKFITERQNYFRTTYPEAFIVDVPAIDDESRTTKTLEASQSYNISIPNNTLTVTFTGKY